MCAGRSQWAKSRAEVQVLGTGRSTGPWPTRVGRMWGRRNGGSLIMPAIGGRSGLLFYCLLSALLAAGNAAAQDAAYFSPTFAASRGSPYREVYAATFVARTVGAPPPEPAHPPVVVPTLVSEIGRTSG